MKLLRNIKNGTGDEHLISFYADHVAAWNEKNAQQTCVIIGVSPLRG